MTDRCEPPYEWRWTIAHAIHTGLGESWAYSNYSGNEWVHCRDMLDNAAAEVWKVITLTPAEADALRRERDEAVKDRADYYAMWEGQVARVQEMERTAYQIAAEMASLRTENARLRETLHTIAYGSLRGDYYEEIALNALKDPTP